MSTSIWGILIALGLLVGILALAAEVPLVITGRRWLRWPWEDSDQVVTRSMRARALVGGVIVVGLLLVLIGQLLRLLGTAEIVNLTFNGLGLLVVLIGYAIRAVGADQLFKDDSSERSSSSAAPRR